jgi:MGT family glycosyltransferase
MGRTGRHIVFLNYPAHSHVYPTIPVVAELVARGHRVSYVVPEQFAGGLREAGATVLGYDSGAPASWGTIAIPERVTGDDLAAAALAHLNEGLLALDAAERALAADRPDALVYDAYGHLAGRVLAKKWRVPSVLSCTTFVANETCDPYAAPSPRSPQVDPGHPALAEHGRRLAETLAAHGLTETPEAFAVPAEDLNLVFLPKSFQIGGETFDDRFAFVGPCLGNREFLGRWSPPASGAPVALVTMGSFAYENQDKFFRLCLEALADLPWHLVLAVGGLVDRAALGPLPGNVEVHAWVPQLSVLEHANAFVAHAGMGSTMESLAFGVPPLLIPRTAEQDLVAARVAELGAGRWLAAEELTAPLLRETFLDLTGDRDAAARARVLAADIAEAGGAARAAREIIALLDREDAR